jgi:methionine-rich copper-binding protein CopC
LPDVAEIPWQVDLNFAGKISARTTAALLPKERHEAMEQIYHIKIQDDKRIKMMC